MRLLSLLALAALTNGCAADQPCCDSRLELTEGARYRTLVPNPDGGVSTEAILVLESPGIVTVTFTSGGREVSQRFSAARRF